MLLLAFKFNLPFLRSRILRYAYISLCLQSNPETSPLPPTVIIISYPLKKIYCFQLFSRNHGRKATKSRFFLSLHSNKILLRFALCATIPALPIPSAKNKPHTSHNQNKPLHKKHIKRSKSSLQKKQLKQRKNSCIAQKTYKSSCFSSNNSKRITSAQRNPPPLYPH